MRDKARLDILHRNRVRIIILRKARLFRRTLRRRVRLWERLLLSTSPVVITTKGRLRLREQRYTDERGGQYELGFRDKIPSLVRVRWLAVLSSDA